MNVLETYNSQLEFDPDISFDHMISLRTQAFMAFSNIETKRGLVKGTLHHLSDSVGQDVFRLFMMRYIEELYEAHDSWVRGDTDEHTKEELIDAVNYLWSAALISGAFMQPQFTLAFFTELNRDSLQWDHKADAQLGIISQMVAQVGLEILPKLRNRSHMNNTQDHYFAHWSELGHQFGNMTRGIMIAGFGTWESFYRMFVAKHDVLMFRIQTGY